MARRRPPGCKDGRRQALPVLILADLGCGGFVVWRPGSQPQRQVQRRVSVEGSALAVLPAAVTKAKAARVPPIHWLKVTTLLMLQLRVAPRVAALTLKVWRKIKAKSVRVATNDELTRVQEALGDEPVFQSSVELEDGSIPEGMKVVNSWQEIQETQLPLTLRFYQHQPRPGWMKSRPVSNWLRTMGLANAIFKRALGPILLWGWSTLIISFIASLTSEMWSSRKSAVYQACLAKVHVVPSWTAMAWFLHRLVRLWGQQVSRGRAELSDVMGMQSSLREARINALQTSMKVLVWAFYLFAVFWHGGIKLSQLLLIPGTTAVVIGWVGREIVANMISGVVLHLTQPFAQGDWISLTGEDIDGWVQDVGSFYTKVVQWDKRPIYVPNAKLMSLNVQNNSRMTHRRIKYELKLRLRDIPKIPTIVRDIQEMINEHEDIDNVQHQLVRWRSVGEFSADIWLSCYTKPSIEGIRLKSYTATQQSILERCSQIVYKHDAAFASSTDRVQYAAGGNPEGSKSLGQLFKDTFNTARESQLESREEVIRQREKDLKKRERKLEQQGEEQARAQKELQVEKEKLAQEAKDIQMKQEREVLKDGEVLAVGAAAAADWENEEVFERPFEELKSKDKEVFESLETAQSMLDVQVVQTEELEKVIEAPEARAAEKVERPDVEAEADGPPVAEGASHAAEAAHEEKAEALTPEQTSDTLAAVTAEDDEEAERRRIPVKEMGD